MCNVVLKASDNISQEKILFSVAVILLGQHCTAKNFVQCCPIGPIQYCTGKTSVQCCPNTFVITLCRYKPFPMLSKRLQTTLHTQKFCSLLPQYSWNNIARVKTSAMLSKRLQTTLDRKKSCPMLC